MPVPLLFFSRECAQSHFFVFTLFNQHLKAEGAQGVNSEVGLQFVGRIADYRC